MLEFHVLTKHRALIILVNRVPQRDRRWADAIQRRHERYAVGSVLAVFPAEVLQGIGFD